MIKVYKINGKTEVHEVFTSPSGKAVFKVAFTKGNLDPKNRMPAKCSTSNPIIQAVIENSPKFNKTIFLDGVYADGMPEEEQPVAPIPVKKSKAKPSVKEMPDVKTIADAATVLVAEGASAADIDGTVETAVRVAKSMGISFPNLKEE